MSAAFPDSSIPPLPAPPRCEVPAFEPVRVGGGAHRLLRRVRRRRRGLSAAGLAMAAVALAAASPHEVGPGPEAGCQHAESHALPR
ncbi:hypothetical protein [Streptomyces sp. H27-D2]|uniref:hypothetical protein n=1 Tax=Streptomyces sp. H27-D2 TaxID=3046304 RepID=UPI002DB59944|nr:hypothetical protein [Streptomyces sp. H27-D2]MEC4015273.1 hypothetical protein [Streptomyces sp. H27-D2]